VGTIRSSIDKITHGRTVKRPITWRLLVVVSVIFVALMYGIVALQNRLEKKWPLDVSVISNEVVAVDSGCEWQLGIRVTNPNERKINVVSFELTRVDDSARGTLASVAPAESVDRIYRLQVDDCDVAAADRRPGDLKTKYRLTGSTTERSVSVPIG
jgi:hypothetical protein